MSELRQPKSILYLNPTADLYGVSKMLFEILEYLPREEFRPVVILPNHGPLEKQLIRMQIEYHILPITVIRRGSVKGVNFIAFLLSILPNIIRMAIFIHANKIDLVHTGATVTLTGAIAAKVVGVPHIWHIHEIISDEFPSLWRFYNVLITWLSVRVICVSKVTAAQFPDQTKIRIVPNGVEIHPTMSKPLYENIGPWSEKKNGDIYIGMIGRISPRKGQSYLLDAFAGLLHQLKGSMPRLIIVGDTFSGYEYYLQSLKAKIKDLGIEDKVSFAGFLDNMSLIYSLMDIVVVPSLLPEGFGLVILEAMAVRVPVIATAHGGALEIIEDNVSGLLVSYNNVDDLSDAMTRLIEYPEERKRLGDGGYQRASQVFDIKKTTSLIFQIYYDVFPADSFSF